MCETLKEQEALLVARCLAHPMCRLMCQLNFLLACKIIIILTLLYLLSTRAPAEHSCLRQSRGQLYKHFTDVSYSYYKKSKSSGTSLSASFYSCKLFIALVTNLGIVLTMVEHMFQISVIVLSPIS